MFLLHSHSYSLPPQSSYHSRRGRINNNNNNNNNALCLARNSRWSPYPLKGNSLRSLPFWSADSNGGSTSSGPDNGNQIFIVAENLAQLMYNVMMTGYTFRNVEFRLELKRSLSQPALPSLLSGKSDPNYAVGSQKKLVERLLGGIKIAAQKR